MHSLPSWLLWPVVPGLVLASAEVLASLPVWLS